MKKICLLFFLAGWLCGCSQADTLRTGDLIFVGIPTDYTAEPGSMSEAISDATGSPGALNLIHVAIAEVQGDSTWIIDATIRRGVDRHPLDTFLTDFTLRDGSLPVFSVKRLKDPRHARQYVTKAKDYLGLPYDTAFLPDNDAFYCSELVRESYRKPDGTYWFENKPMNFKAPDGTLPEYWVQLFAGLGMSVPQDVPGTNPQDMSEAPCLVPVPVTFPEKP